MAYEAMVYGVDHNLSAGGVGGSVAGRAAFVGQFRVCGDEESGTDL